MKFSLKMALSVLLLLTLCLTLNGYLMIRQNFNDSLASSVEQNTRSHNEGCYYIEKETARCVFEQNAQWIEAYTSNPEGHEDLLLYGRGKRFVDYALVQAGQAFSQQSEADSRWCSIRFADGTPIFTAMPDGIALNEQMAAVKLAADEYSLCRAGQEIFMFISTPLIVPERDVSLVSAYKVTSVFTSRDTQLRNLAAFTLCTLAAAALLTAFLSGYLTRPLKKLKASSELIASGNYAERTAIKTDDEFGAVSRSFDAMAAAVEKNVGELKMSVRQREDFVAAFTHEIKTPMSAMLGYSSLLCSGMEDPEQQRTAHEYIWRETRRLEALSQKLMLLMGLKDERIHSEPVALCELCESLISTLPNSDKQITIMARGDKAVRVMGDPVLLDDLLRNLLLNARNASENGGEVTIDWLKKNETVEVTVGDNGCGISEENLKRITEPFYMVDKSRARAENGSGMGLALAARIAELHGGALSFDSALGVGTKVSFSLLAAKEEHDENL